MLRSGATSHEVRDHFLQWVPNELRDRLKPNPPPAELFSVQNSFVNGAARYKFCLFVDDICLESLDQKGSNWPVVKVLEKNWGPLPADQRQYKIHPDYHDGETDEEEEEIGWMYMPADWYMEWYDLLTKVDDFYGFYARPPYISLGFPEDEVVGFWRDQPGN